MLRKNVKSLLEQLQVCIFAKIVFGVRCTLIKTAYIYDRDYRGKKRPLNDDLGSNGIDASRF